MIRLFVKNNITGKVHEVGTNSCDYLFITVEGAIHYYNFQTESGTLYPEIGYSFCNKDGVVPNTDHPSYQYTGMIELDFR